MDGELLPVFTTAEWILGILAVYLAAVVIFGIVYGRRRVAECSDLIIAGRGLNFPLCVASILSSWICAGALLGAAAFAFLFGMQGVIFDPWAPAIAMILVGLFFASRLRRARYVTVTDFMDSRYDRRMGMLYSIIQVLAATTWQAGLLVALGTLISLTTGIGVELAVLAAVAVIFIVPASGGLGALARVDLIVLVVVVIGLAILFPTVIAQAGGWGTFVATATNWAGLPTWAMTPLPDEQGYLFYTGAMGIFLYVAAWSALSLGDAPSQLLNQRVLAAKDERTATLSFMTSGIAYLVLGLMVVTIGIAAFTLGVEVSPDRAEQVLPWIAYQSLPDWAGVLLIVAIAAAVISTCSSCSLGIGSLAGNNIYRYFKPQAGDREMLWVVRVTVVASALLAMALALYFEDVYRLIVLSGGLVLPTIFAPYFFGHFWRKANRTGALAAFFAGLATWVIAYFWALPTTKVMNTGILAEGEVYMEWAVSDALFIAITPAGIVSVLTLIVVSLLTQRTDPPRPIRDVEGREMPELRIVS
jgi:Na+/proline symporter